MRAWRPNFAAGRPSRPGVRRRNVSQVCASAAATPLERATTLAAPNFDIEANAGARWLSGPERGNFQPRTWHPRWKPPDRHFTDKPLRPLGAFRLGSTRWAAFLAANGHDLCLAKRYRGFHAIRLLFQEPSTKETHIFQGQRVVGFRAGPICDDVPQNLLPVPGKSVRSHQHKADCCECARLQIPVQYRVTKGRLTGSPSAMSSIRTIAV